MSMVPAEMNKVSRLLLLVMAMAMAMAAAAAAAALFDGSSTVVPMDACGQDATEMVLQCYRYVAKEGPKVEPSKACCGEVHKFEIGCVCNSLPPGAEQYLSMEKLVYVARCCGKKVPTGTKCGSYVVPPAGGRA